MLHPTLTYGQVLQVLAQPLQQQLGLPGTACLYQSKLPNLQLDAS